jgi:hypothetical protein
MEEKENWNAQRKQPPISHSITSLMAPSVAGIYSMTRAILAEMLFCIATASPSND